MATTIYRVKSGEHVIGDAHSSKDVQALLKDAAPGEYPIELVDLDAAAPEGRPRYWGKAIKHEGGMVHLDGENPGE
jgi:hypothetical protein